MLELIKKRLNAQFSWVRMPYTLDFTAKYLQTDGNNSKLSLLAAAIMNHIDLLES